jgi:uncharacterized protein YdgA (DUF945 family)
MGKTQLLALNIHTPEEATFSETSKTYYMAALKISNRNYCLIDLHVDIQSLNHRAKERG